VLREVSAGWRKILRKVHDFAQKSRSLPSSSVRCWRFANKSFDVPANISTLSEKADKGTLYFMSTLWFPGRPPMCSDILLPLFTQYLEILMDLAESKNGTAIELLENIQDDALMYIEGENSACLDTDPVLTKLKEMLVHTTEAARLAYLQQEWGDILTLAANMDIVRDELAKALNSVTA